MTARAVPIHLGLMWANSQHHEGRSARADANNKRPVFRKLLEDAAKPSSQMGCSNKCSQQ